MAKALEFALKMIDKVSGPAKDIGGALSGVTSKLSLAGKAMSGASVISMGIGMRIGGGLVDAAISGAKFAFQAGKFRDDTILALKAVDGSAEAAAKTFDRIQKITNITPFGPEEVANAMMGLRAAGKTQEVAEGIFGIASDLASMGAGNKSENLSKVMHGINKAMAQGKFSMETFEGMTSIGGASAFLKSYAKLNKITAEDASKALSSGRIDTGSGMAALMDMATGGGKRGVGDITKDMGLSTVDGQLASIKNTLFGILSMDTSGMVKWLESFNSNLSAAAPGLKSMFGILQKGAGEAFGAFTSAVSEVFNRPEFQALLQRLGEKMPEYLRTLGRIFGVLGTVGSGAVYLILSALEIVMPVVTKLVDMTEWLLNQATATNDTENGPAGPQVGWSLWGGLSITEASSESYEHGKGLGADIAKGATKGFKDNIGALGTAGTDAFTAVKNKWDGDWDRHSPSGVTYDLFSDVGAGMVLGLDDSIQPLSKSMEGLVSGVTSGVSQGVSGGGGRSIVNNFNISSSDPKEAAAEVQRVIESYFLQWSAA